MFDNSGGGGRDNFFGDLLNLFSIMLGYENLMENRQQSADNDIAKHNQQQAKIILDDLHEQFDRQNKMLEYQNNILRQLLENKKEIKDE